MRHCKVAQYFQALNELFGPDGDEAMLEYKEIQVLNAKLYKTVPRLRAQKPPGWLQTAAHLSLVVESTLRGIADRAHVSCELLS